MKDNKPEDFASPEALKSAGLLKSPRDMLIEAEKKIASLELTCRNLHTDNQKFFNQIDTMKWQNAQLRVAITALGKHFNCPPDEAKKIVDAYIAEQDAEYQRLADEAKKKFTDDLKAGKVPDLKVLDGDAPPIPPKQEG